MLARTLLRTLAALGGLASLLAAAPVAAQTSIQSDLAVSAQISRKIAQDSATRQAAYALAAGATVDADGYYLPPTPTVGASLAGGGLVPASSGAPTTDGSGVRLGYCAWDNGSITGASGYLAGSNSLGAVVLAVVSPGADNAFSTTCAQIASGQAASGDDFYVAYTSGQVLAGVQGTTYFSDPVPTAADLALIAPGALKDGQVRLVRDTNALYRYSTVSGWIPVVAPWQSGASAGDLYYTAGNIAIGTATPQRKLTVQSAAVPLGLASTGNRAGTDVLDSVTAVANAFFGFDTSANQVRIEGQKAGSAIVLSTNGGSVSVNAAGVLNAPQGISSGAISATSILSSGPITTAALQSSGPMSITSTALTLDAPTTVTGALNASSGLASTNGTFSGTVTANTVSATSVLVNGNAVWHAGNFDPTSYVAKAGDTMTGNLVLSGDGQLLRPRAATTAGNPGLRIENSGGVRIVELLALGTTSGGAYGATAGQAVLNTSVGVPLVLSTGDTRRVTISATGAVGINGVSAGENLSVFGTARIANGTGTGPSLVLTGGGSNLQFNHTSGIGTVQLANSGGPIAFAAGGITNQMTLENSGALLIGIATNPTTAKLVVNNTGSTKTAVTIGDITDTTSETGIYLRTNSVGYINTGSNGSLSFGNAAGVYEFMRLDSTGSLLIGRSTNSGLGVLQTNGDVDVSNSSTARLRTRSIGSFGAFSLFQNSLTGSSATDGLEVGINADGLSASLWNYEAGPIVVGTNNAERMRIAANGMVGIGTNTPQSILDVRTSSSTALSLTRNLDVTSVGDAGTFVDMGAMYGANRYAGAAMLGALKASGTEGFLQLQVRRAGTLTSRLHIGADGVGVGTTSPSTDLHIHSSSATSSNLLLTGSGSTNYGGYISGTLDPGNGGNLAIGVKDFNDYSKAILIRHQAQSLSFFTGAAASANPERARLDVNGNFGIGVTAPTSRLTVSSNTGNFTGTMPTGTVIHAIGADGTNARINIDALGSNAVFQGRRANGTLASPTAVLNGQDIVSWGGNGYDGSSWTSGFNGGIFLVASENFTPTNKGTSISFRTSQNGSTSALEKMRLEDNGNLSLGVVNQPWRFAIGTSLGQGTVGILNNTLPTAADERLGLIHFGAQGESTASGSRITSFSAGAWVSGASTGSDLRFSTTPVGGALTYERMRIAASGNVGIGTSTPRALLEVALNSGDSSIAEVLRVSRVSGTTAMASERSAAITFYDDNNPTLTGAIAGYRTNPAGNYNGGLRFFYNGSGGSSTSSVTGLTEGMRLTETGAVGIGRTPVNKFDVQGGSMAFWDATGANYISFVPGAIGRINGNNTLSLQTAGVSRVTIDNAGNTGIGIAPLANVKLMVNSAADQNFAVLTQGGATTATALTNTGSAARLRVVGLGLEMSGDGSSTHFSINNLGNAYLGPNIGAGVLPARLAIQESTSGVGVEVRSFSSENTGLQRSYTTTLIAGSGANTGGNGNVAIKFHHNDFYNLSGDISFWTKDATNTQFERMRVDSTGNVGLGITAPLARLHVADSAYTGTLQLGGTSEPTRYGARLVNGTSAGMTYLSMQVNQNNAGYVEGVRLDGLGNLGVGRINSQSGYRVEVEGNTWTTGKFVSTGAEAMSLIHNTGYIGGYNSSLARTGYLQFASGSSVALAADGATTSLVLITNAAQRVIVDPSGNVGIGKTPAGYMLDVNGLIRTTGAVTTTSDSRVKHNIVTLDADEMIRRFKKIRPVHYALNGSNLENYGYIAQELEPLFPEMVMRDSEGMYGVQYTQMLPVLTAVTQRHQALIEDLQANKLDGIVGKWAESSDKKGRFLFEDAGKTVVRGHGATALEVRNSEDAVIASFMRNGNMDLAGIVNFNSGRGGFAFNPTGTLVSSLKAGEIIINSGKTMRAAVRLQHGDSTMLESGKVYGMLFGDESGVGLADASGRSLLTASVFEGTSLVTVHGTLSVGDGNSSSIKLSGGASLSTNADGVMQIEAPGGVRVYDPKTKETVISLGTDGTVQARRFAPTDIVETGTKCDGMVGTIARDTNGQTMVCTR